MDWNTVYGFAMIGMSWAFCGMLGLNLGIKLERYRIAKEEVVYLDEAPEHDAEYWKNMYEELADEWAELHCVGKYARRETT